MNHFSLLSILMIFLIPLSAWVVTADPCQDTADNLSVNQSFFVNADNIVPIGILVMQSGFIADIGEEYIRAFQMAQEDNPCMLIDPVIMDGGSEPAVAISSWGNMKSSMPDIPVVVTVSSWTSNVVYPDAADAGIVQIALGSAAINRSKTSDLLIRYTPGVGQESPVLGSYLSGFDRIAVVGGDNDYSRDYYSALEKLLPDTLVLHEIYDQNDVNKTLDIYKIGESRPDAIVLLSVSEGGKVVEMLRNANISVPFIGTRVIERNSLAETPAAEGLLFTTPQLNRSHPFFSRYTEKYGEEPTFYAAEGYDTLATVCSAISACGNSSECIASWYINRTTHGALGTVQFDGNGVATYPIGFKIVHDGRFEEVNSSLTEKE